MYQSIENDVISIALSGNMKPVMELTDLRSGVKWSDKPWHFKCIIQQGQVYEANCIEIIAKKIRSQKGIKKYTFTFKVLFNEENSPDIVLKYTLSLPEYGGWFEESIELFNKSEEYISLIEFILQWQNGNAKDLSYLPVPFASCSEKPGIRKIEGGTGYKGLFEGLILKNGNYGITIAKKPSDVEPQWIGIDYDEKGDICYAGVSRGVPADLNSISINSNKGFSFGSTRYILFSGDFENGLLDYREFMSKNNVRLPENYNPPINYNIYYEFPGDSFFQKKDLYDSIKQAKELGCTMLYTDQGWETYFGSGIWDEVRLGKAEDFAQFAESNGLDVGVLVPMHTTAYTFPLSAMRKDKNGDIIHGDPWHTIGICPTSPAWQKKKFKNLKKVAASGIKFFSYDFNNNDTQCFDSTHPHSLPMREWEHVKAVAKHQEKIKKACPGVLIEAHDWMDAGLYKYPVYMFNSGHHERWGFEYMWSPFEDFKSGRLHNLYYYNMAYEKPLYLHMNLTNDNENAVVFWYIASTVRHFGVGDYKKLTPEKKELYKKLMGIYKNYKRYFSNGRFMGMGPLVHIHSLQEEGSIVLLFNDAEEVKNLKMTIGLEELGIESKPETVMTLFGEEIRWSASEGRIHLELDLKGYSAVVAYIR